jgi:hypothetical protein
MRAVEDNSFHSGRHVSLGVCETTIGRHMGNGEGLV